jgi:hypothetical protein
MVALLFETGHLNPVHFLDWYTRWWPALLICAGLLALVESWLHRHEHVSYDCSSGIKLAFLICCLALLLWHHGSFGIYVSGHRLNENDLAHFLAQE